MKQTFLENTAETREYLESLPKIYMIARWAGCGVQEFPFAGRCDDKGIPFVYVHDDCNGTCDCYFLRKLTNTTTGWIYAWTTSKSRAEEIAAALNERTGEGGGEKPMMSIILSSIAIVLSIASLLIMLSIDHDNN